MRQHPFHSKSLCTLDKDRVKGRDAHRRYLVRRGCELAIVLRDTRYMNLERALSTKLIVVAADGGDVPEGNDIVSVVACRMVRTPPLRDVRARVERGHKRV